MALILCVETATRNCSVSVSENGQLMGAIELEETAYSHAEKLHLFIRDLLKDLKLTLQDMDAIAVSKGPGSYTGLRIGVSAAKGFCVPLKIPLISIATPEHMAAGIFRKHPNAKWAAPMLDARRMEVYCAVYDKHGSAQLPIDARIIEEDFFSQFSGQIVFGGDGAEKCAEFLQGSERTFDGTIQASAIDMVQLAYEKFQKGSFEDVAYFEPYYLKDFVAGKPKKLL
jgi:tRNA threonylcarbamoyladenosine biosynthesis protein TsaB